MRFVIVGAGLAGAWLSRAAADAGHRVTVVTDGAPSADQAALGLLRSTYLSKELRPLMKRSLGLWEGAGAEVLSGAEVSRWDTDAVKDQRDWFAVNPQLPRGRYDDVVLGRAEPDTDRSVVVDGELVEGDVVVWCDGSGEGRRTFGHTWVSDDPGAFAFSGGLRVHHVAPYKTLAGARFSGCARLGSSSASSREKAQEQAVKLMDLAVGLGWVEPQDPAWRLVSGTRIQRDDFLTRDEYGWRWAGFHRNGFAVVPATAETVVAVVS